MSAGRKFAIVGYVGATRFYWTGSKRKPWTTMETRAKTWRSDSIAASWFPRVPKGLAMMGDLRIVELQP